MKSVILIILAIFSSYFVKADVGACRFYEVKVQLKDNFVLSGYLQLASRNILPKNNDQLLSYLKSEKEQKNGKIRLFESIQTINFPKPEEPVKIKYSAASLEDMRVLSLENIKQINIVEMKSCECKLQRTECEYSDSDFQIAYYHKLIILAQKEIDQLNSAPHIFSNTVQVDQTDIDVFAVLSYNQELDQSAFNDLSNQLKFPKQDDQTWDDYAIKRQKHINQVRESLREKGIIIIELFSYT